MSDLKSLTHAQFEACLNQPFHIAPEDGDPLELELIEVEKRGAFDPNAQKRQAFSAILRGPMEPVLPQKIYALRNESIGTLDIFLVPIGSDKQGMRYEAVFT